jgi:hypothetical protein
VSPELRDYVVVGVAVAAPVTLIAILAALAQQQAAQQSVLMLTVSGPGTIDIPTGTHSFPAPTEVTITATPVAGYQANWNLNGVDVEQGVNVYSVYVTGVVTLGVYFTPTGPTYGPIAGIRSVGTVGTLQNFDYYYSFDGGPIIVDECDENWTRLGQCAPALMQFKVYDAGGVGIPGVEINIYPDSNPDTTVFKAYALFDPNLSGPFNGSLFDVNNPLILTTDNNGLVSFRIRNIYYAEAPGVDGFGKQLSTSTGVYATKGIPPFAPIANDKVFPIYKGLYAGLGYVWWQGGGGGTVQYNRNIRAVVYNTAYYTEQPITVSFGTKWG